MPKYIELSSLLEKLQTTSIVTDDLYGMGIMSGMDAARKIVAEQPIIDAEPVVIRVSKIIIMVGITYMGMYIIRLSIR